MMVEQCKLLPREVDIRSGLVKLPAHIVAQSVARSIVQYGQKENVWPKVTALLLKREPFCHESPAVVQMMLDQLFEKGLLLRDETLVYSVTERFVFYCERIGEHVETRWWAERS